MDCARPVGNMTFFKKDESIYCEGCFVEKYAFKCAFCTESITGVGLYPFYYLLLNNLTNK